MKGMGAHHLLLLRRKEKPALLKRVISTSPKQGRIQLPTGGTVKYIQSRILLCHTKPHTL